MGKAPAFQLYAADFYMDTADWSATDVGIYFRLLMFEWVNGAIPDDTERLSRIAGIDHGNFKKCWCRSVEGKFVPNGEGKLINVRLEEVRKKQEEYIKKQVESGRLGGLKAQERNKIFPRDPSSGASSGGSGENQALQSSSSTSINKEKEKLKEKETTPFFTDDQIERLDELRRYLISKFPRFLAHRWIWEQEQAKKNPEAIIHALSSLRAAVDKNGAEYIRDARAYLEKIISVEDGNYNAAQWYAEDKKSKVDFGNIVDDLKKLQEAKTGKEIPTFKNSPTSLKEGAPSEAQNKPGEKSACGEERAANA